MDKNNFKNFLSRILPKKNILLLEEKKGKNKSTTNDYNKEKDYDEDNKKKNDNSNNLNSMDKVKNRKIENLVVFIIILVVTLILVKYIFSGSTENTRNVENYSDAELVFSGEENTDIETSDYSEKLEEELKEILKKIDGVGDVDILITFSETSKIVPIYNESSSNSKTEETDTSGGSRIIENYDSNKEVVSDENSEPVTEKVVMPKIEGAIVTAEGAGDASVKNNIISAVEAATGLAMHKIQVFEMNK